MNALSCMQNLHMHIIIFPSRISTENEMQDLAVPSEANRPGVGGVALGVICRLLTTLRMMYGVSRLTRHIPCSTRKAEGVS